MVGFPGARAQVAGLVRRRAVRLAVGIAFGVLVIVWEVRDYAGASTAEGAQKALFDIVYNVPIFFLFGLWLCRVAQWVVEGRWLQLLIAAAALAAVLLRLGPARHLQLPLSPASGHAVFLAYVLMSTCGDRLLWVTAAVILAEVVVIKVAVFDWLSLSVGLAAGALLGLAALRAARRDRSVSGQAVPAPHKDL
jgi:hypothetical protein